MRPFRLGMVGRVAMSVAVACAASEWLARQAIAEVENAKPRVKKAVVRYAPEVEEKLVELMEAVKEPRRKVELERLNRELAALSRVVGLRDDQRKTLEAAAEKASAQAAEEWLGGFEETLRTNWGGNLQVENVEALIRTPSNLVRNNPGLDHVPAIERSEWQDAIAQTLDVSQTEKYQTDLKERNREFEEQIKNVVNATRERTREQFRSGLDGTVATMSAVLSLGEERTKKLEGVAEKAAEAAAEPVRAKARRMLLEFDDMRRKQVLRTNSLYLPPDENDDPEEQPVWKNGLKELLTAEELEKWEELSANRFERKVEAEARVLVWTMDGAIAFTSAQREQLLPLARMVVRENSGLLRKRRPNVYVNYNVQTYYQFARTMDEEKLRPILDSDQLRRWQDVSAMRRRTGSTVVNLRLSAPAVSKPMQTAAAADPEELEAAISAYLYALVERERERMEGDAVVRAEDAIRVTGVEGQSAMRLRLAAKGAVQRDFENWTTSISTSIRNQAKNVSLATIQQWLENMRHNFTFSLRRQNQPAPSLWEKTVQSELQTAQRAAWEEELKSREEFENETSSAYVLTQMDEICVLSEKQWDYLADALERVLARYGADLEQMFSPGTVWFGQSHYMLVPVCGLPESELREILSEAQVKRFMESEQYANAQQYWEHIEMRNQQREREIKNREEQPKRK